MNYGEIKQAVAGYLHRTDAGPMMPTFLALAEQRIYAGEANSPAVRVSSMLKTVALASGARPADFVEAKQVNSTAARLPVLEYRPLNELPHTHRAFSWDGQSMVLSEHEAFPVTLIYYARFPTPVADTDTNWLATNAPNVYITSMLTEAARWARDDALGVREASNYASAVASLMSADKAAQHSGSMLRMKVRNAR